MIIKTIDIKNIRAHSTRGIQNHPDPNLRQNPRNGTPSPRADIVEQIQRDFPGISFEQYNKDARMFLTEEAKPLKRWRPRLPQG